MWNRSDVIYGERLVYILTDIEHEILQERNQMLLPMVKNAVRLGLQFIEDGHSTVDVTEAFALASASLMMLMIPKDKVQIIREQSTEMFNQLRERLKDSGIGNGKFILSQVIAFVELLAFATSTSAYALAEVAKQAGDFDGSGSTDSGNTSG